MVALALIVATGLVSFFDVIERKGQAHFRFGLSSERFNGVN